jgi:hypothetical protein
VRAPLPGLCLWLVLAFSPVRGTLEGEMITHMMVQLPLLGLSGWLMGQRLRSLPQAGEYRFALVIVATAASSFWMLPRWLDAALADPLVEAAKFLSLPLLAGLPLSLAWPRLGVIARGLVVTNAISMLATVGWLFRALPDRLCARYRLDQQQVGGTGMLIASLVLTLVLVALALRGRPSGPPVTPGIDQGQGQTPDGAAMGCTSPRPALGGRG